MSQSQEVQQASATGPIPLAAELQARARVLTGFWKAVAIAFGSAAILLALNQLLNLGFFVGEVLLDTAYLYALAALLVGLVFLFVPATKSAARDHVPWYDAVLFVASVGVFLLFRFQLLSHHF